MHENKARDHNMNLKNMYTKSFLGILRKQQMSREVATWALGKWPLSNERRNSILMTRHYPDLGSASDSGCFEIPSRFNQSEATPRSG